ncbi:MAG: META domain-containing protein [Pseudomonadota bacterium]
MNRLALIVLSLLLSGCSLFLPSGASCSRRLPMFSSCASPAPVTASQRANSLEDTYWRLVRLSGAVVRDGLALREAHLRLDAIRQKASGSGGCNQMTGRYTLSGTDEIRFSDMVSTRMACPGMELEQDFLKSLEQTVRWRIDGERLQLLDASGTELVTLQAAASR